MPLIQDTVLAPRDDSEDGRDDLEGAVEGLLGAWRNSGQIWKEPLFAWIGSRLHVSVLTPESGSLDARYDSEWGSTCRAEVDEFAVASPVWEIRGGGDESMSAWRSCSSLHLFTHLFDQTSPVCRGDDGSPIPLYLLPLTTQQRQGLVHWMCQYRDHDSIWIDSGDLELPALRQLSDHDSGLAAEARELAADIEKATGLPTYTTLLRYDLGLDEATAPCPRCGGPFRREANPDSRGIDWFDFRCDPCRLLSLEDSEWATSQDSDGP